MNSTIILCSVICLAGYVQGQTSANKTYNLLIGTYTSPGKSDGIYVYTFNTETGEFHFKAEATGIKNPSFLAISKDRQHVYAVSEIGEGSVSAFAFNAATGALTYLNKASSGGNGPCHITVDDQKKYVFTGNYGGGSLAAIPVNADGSLGKDIQSIQHYGSSIRKSNQSRPHVHATVLSPDNRYLFVPDLGTDKINIYQVDRNNSEPLSPASPAFAVVEPGSGPRHFTFHPNKKFAYVIQEMTGMITFFDYKKNGILKANQTVNPVPSDFSGKIDAADIHISPDGNFLYGSLRGDIDELIIYSIGKKGQLTYVGSQSTLGKSPRNFTIDPTGNFLLVGNHGSDEIIIFKRDQKTGLLASTGKKISIGAPVCLKFVEIN